MPSRASAIFTLAGTDFTQLTARLSAAYPSANRTPPQPWSLHHTLYRTSNPSTAQSPQTGNQASSNSLQFLQLSTTPQLSFLCTSSEAGPFQSIAIPQGPATADFRRLLQEKFGPFWQLVRQSELHVSNGAIWDVGIVRVHLGELVRDRGSGAGGFERRGTVLRVSLLAEEDAENEANVAGDDEAQIETGLLRDFCSNLGLYKAQNGMKVLTEVWSTENTWATEPELWCQVLRTLSIINSSGKPR